MSVRTLLRAGLAVMWVVASGCAGYRLTAISPEDAEAAHKCGDNTEGYVFYEPAVYFAVVPGQNGLKDIRTFTLPDYERPYRFTRYELLAKSDLDIAFEEGWRFTGAKSKTDSTAVPAAFADILGKLRQQAGGDERVQIYRLRRPAAASRALEVEEVRFPPTLGASPETSRTPGSGPLQFVARDGDQPERDRSCGTPVPDEATRLDVARRVAPLLDAERLRDGVPKPVTISVRFHVIHDGTSGNVSEALLDAQVAVLNRAFADGGITFVKNQPVSRTEDTALFRMTYGSAEERRAKERLGVEQRRSLNVYVCGPVDGTLGWATFPWDLDTRTAMDGIVIDYQSLPTGVGPFGGGHTATHEVGHWLGLYHTFQGGCAPPGDEISDTPAQLSPSRGCPVGRDSCLGGGNDPIHNFMDYSHDACMREFTVEQSIRMRSMLRLYRPEIG